VNWRYGGPRLVALGSLLLSSGCGGPEEVTPPTMDQTISVTSPVLREGQPVPATYTCDGANLAPPLTWTGVPGDAAALALVVDDPDAPSGTFTHWVVLDIPPDVGSSDEGGVPRDGVQSKNSAGRAGYFGPCPPSGTHHYRFTVYALSEPTGLGGGAALGAALDAVQERAVAWGRLTTTYSRS
jgi:Raf kinase inhibitor-like YbhB/YbcL family protein